MSDADNIGNEYQFVTHFLILSIRGPPSYFIFGLFEYFSPTSLI